KYIDPSDKAKCDEMIEESRSSIIEILRNQNWLNDEYHKHIILKIEDMKYICGYPEWIFDELQWREMFPFTSKREVAKLNTTFDLYLYF
ncbi:hypothetical protein, partial [Escherichia coli]|uniref:hypothetical protein n=1 Tax=Escherichia coli TaxID=562 RepID=UPI003F211D86